MCQSLNMSLICKIIFLNATTIILAKQAFGSVSNNGPNIKITNKRIVALYKVLTSVLPPEDSLTLVLDSEPDEGKHRKNELKIFVIPYAYSSYLNR